MRLSEVPRTALFAETGMLKKVKSSDNGQLNQDKVEFTGGIGKNYGIQEKLGVKNS